MFFEKYRPLALKVVILGCSSITGVTTPGAGPSALPVMGRGPGGERVMVDGSMQDTYLLS